MGKAVPKNIKSKANTLLAMYPSEVSEDFDKNKQFINSLGMPLSKEVRNLIAGFLTRQKGKQSQ